MGIAAHLSSCQYRVYFVVAQSAEPITGPPWVLRQFRHHAGIAPCLGDPAFPANVATFRWGPWQKPVRTRIHAV